MLPLLIEGQRVFDCRGPTDALRLRVESVLADLQKDECSTQIYPQRLEHLLSLQFTVAAGVCNMHPSILQKLCELQEMIRVQRALAAPQHRPERCWGEHLVPLSLSLTRWWVTFEVWFAHYALRPGPHVFLQLHDGASAVAGASVIAFL
jgi:hypothetical protein